MASCQGLLSLGISFIIGVSFDHYDHHPCGANSIFFVLLCGLVHGIFAYGMHQIRQHDFDPQNQGVFEHDAQDVDVGSFVSFLGALVCQRRFCPLFG